MSACSKRQVRKEEWVNGGSGAKLAREDSMRALMDRAAAS